MGVQFIRGRIVSTKAADGKSVTSLVEDGAALPSLFGKRVSRSSRGNKKFETIPGTYPIYIPFGFDGPSIKMQAHFSPGTSEQRQSYYTSWAKVVGMDILRVTANDVDHDGVPGGDGAVVYSEFPVGSQWYVEDILTDRQAGMMVRWDMELTLHRRWRDINGQPILTGNDIGER